MLTEQTLIDKIEILPDGQMQVRTVRRVYDGDDLIAQQFHRIVHAPDTDIATLPDARLQAVAKALWLPEVVADYNTLKETNKI